MLSIAKWCKNERSAMEREKENYFSSRDLISYIISCSCTYVRTRTRTHMHTYIQKYRFFCAVKRFRFDLKKIKKNKKTGEQS